MTNCVIYGNILHVLDSFKFVGVSFHGYKLRQLFDGLQQYVQRNFVDLLVSVYMYYV